MITIKGGKEKHRIAVLDDSGLLHETRLGEGITLEFIKDETESTFVKKYKDKKYDAFLYIPKINIDSPRNIRLHSTASVSLPLLKNAEETVNKAIENERLKASAISAADYDKIASEIQIENTIDTETGSKKSVAGIAYAVSFACGMLIYLMMIIYGTQVMRGVSEEKTNRIAEVMVSSVKPFQLMTGKIIGIGAVGLTQFAIWAILIFSMQLAIPLIFPDIMNQITSAAAGGVNEAQTATVLQGLSSLPLMKIGLLFMFYFLAGYLTYASLFAAVGSMATDDQQDTQQLMFPI